MVTASGLGLLPTAYAVHKPLRRGGARIRADAGSGAAAPVLPLRVTVGVVAVRAAAVRIVVRGRVPRGAVPSGVRLPFRAAALVRSGRPLRFGLLLRPAALFRP